MAKREITVLLIEDDPVAAGLFEAQIASDFTTRFETVTADTFGKALELIDQRVFDVAALDLILPDARGLEALDRLRAAADELPIVVLTGLDDEGMAVEALQHGAQDYLVKGELTGRLISRSLRYAIERQRLTEALRALSLLDEPSGLFNRRGFTILAEQQLKTARRFGRGIGLIEIEVAPGDDGGAGDERRGAGVAKVLCDTFRGSGAASRLEVSMSSSPPCRSPAPRSSGGCSSSSPASNASTWRVPTGTSSRSSIYRGQSTSTIAGP